jgi:Cytochrome b5-like Heme/Steroid binding domain
MNNKNLIWLPIVLGIILVGGIVAFFTIPKNSSTQTQPNENVDVTSTINSNKQPSLSANTDRDIQPVPKGSAQPTTTPTNNTPKLTAADVATHNTAASCYVSYQKQIYDLTSFIGRHDGGAESILNNCGKDINDLSALHPGGNFSSPKVQKAIKSLVIGVLE